MGITNIHLLLVAVFLHFMCAGLVIPILPRYMVTNGASQVVTGTLHAAAYVCQGLCKDVIALFIKKEKETIVLSQALCFVYYFILVYYDDMWIICCIRCLYALTVRITYLAKDYVKLTEPEEKQPKLLNIVHASRVSGTAFGAILGGYIFECSKDIESNAMVASALTLMSVLVLQLIDVDKDITAPKSELPHLPVKFWQSLKILKSVHFGFCWEDIYIKIAYVFTFVVYYSRYTFLISSSYDVDNIFLGYVIAYDHILFYFCQCLVPFMTDRTADQELFVEFCLMVCGILICGLFYAPTKICYLILLCPVIFLHNVINDLLKNDIFYLKTLEHVDEAVETITVLVNIFIPILFGFVCEYWPISVFKILALLPMAYCVYLLNERFMEEYMEEEENEQSGTASEINYDDEEEEGVIDN